MRRSERLPVTTCVALVALAGCASAAHQELYRNRKLDPGSAYVYGRFVIDTKDSVSIFGDETLTFEIRCREGTIYPIRFTKGEPLQLIQVRPSTCQIEDIVFDDATAGSRGGVLVPTNAGLVGAILVAGLFTAIERDTRPRQMASFRLLRNEFLEPGGVYYVGDFYAKATAEGPGTNQRNSWTATRKNNYERTTEELARRLVNFSPEATQSRM
jgi:hypothetical protein